MEFQIEADGSRTKAVDVTAPVVPPYRAGREAGMVCVVAEEAEDMEAVGAASGVGRLGTWRGTAIRVAVAGAASSAGRRATLPVNVLGTATEVIMSSSSAVLLLVGS